MNLVQHETYGGVWVATGMEARASIENPRYSLSDPRIFDEIYGGLESSSGETVSVETALCLSAVWEIVSMISADVAKLPLSPYTRTTDDQGEEIGKKIDKKHPAWKLLRKQSNEFQSSYHFRRALTFCALMCNNSFAYIERTRGGVPVSLRILNPLKTAIVFRGSSIYVESSDNQSNTPLPIELNNIIHISGPSWDGFQGLDIIRYARDTFGTALAAQRFTSRFFKNGVQAGGFIKLPLGSTKKQADTLEEGFYRKFNNSENHFKTVVLRDGAEWQPNTFSAKDADLAALRNQAKVDICNFFGINPAKVGVPGYSSYNSQEQANREYLDNCLSTHLANEIHAFEPKLLTEDEYLSDSMKLEHNTNALLMMDLDKRANVYASAIRNGWMNPNTVRAKENMEPRPGGDEYASLGQVFGGSSGGGADKTPVDPTDPNEPGEATAAKNGRSVEMQRVILGITSHARSKTKTSLRFCEWVKGNLTSHRSLARDIGVDESIIDEMLEDFQAVKADDSTIAAQVEVICKKWEAGE